MVLKNLLDRGVGSWELGVGGGNLAQTLIPVSRSILERMTQSSDRQLRLINSLLEVHASEVGGITLQRESVQLAELVQFLVEDFEPLVAKNQATLINRVPDHLPAISVDSAQLRRVFENLLSNAFNHNPPGISLTLDARVEEDMIRCTVADNGVGMSKEMCDHLFQLGLTHSVRNCVILSDSEESQTLVLALRCVSPTNFIFEVRMPKDIRDIVLTRV